MLGAWHAPKPSTTRTSAAASLSTSSESLPAKRAAKIDDYVEEHLNGKPPDAPPPEYPISSQIEGELRVRFANTRYRILYQRSGNLIVLLHAIEKHTGAVPDADIGLAKADGRLQAPHGRRARGPSASGG